jgi:uncharacterized membrane protein
MPLYLITKTMYSNMASRSVHMLSLFLVIFLVLISITPPLQSPDEYDHVKRAYALGEGTVFFKPLGNQSSGAMIDDGLIKYINLYEPLGLDPERKVNAKDSEIARELRWEGTKSFSATPATAFYFPLIYAPQAFALKLGKLIGLSINQSYYLTRFVTSATALVIIGIAFAITAPSPVALALLAMPMSVYQFSSTSLDGIATALSVLVISIFLKLFRDPPNTNKKLFWLALASFGLLASSRLQLLPLFLLFFVLFIRDKNKVQFTGALIALGLVCTWILVAGKYTIDHRVPSAISSGQVALAYVQNPLSLFQVIWNTLTDEPTLRGYFSSFLGMLGWLTAPFPGRTYIYLAIAMLAVCSASLSVKYIKANWQVIVLFLLIALVSVFLILFAMLTTWTPYPSDKIIGVQGRYFLIPVILMSYALFPPITQLTHRRSLSAHVLVLGFALYSLFMTINLLLSRYYIAIS